MEVILLEPIKKLGKIGDIVTVKNGFGRNFLIPNHKALRATEENKKVFEDKKVDLELKHNRVKAEAEVLVEQINGKIITVIKQSSDDGRLFGSVSNKEIAKLISDNFAPISYLHVMLHDPIKSVGVHKVEIVPYGDVRAEMLVNVARSETEAQAAISSYNSSNSSEELDLVEGE